MFVDLTRMLLFPALMAFAAASDLLTMTISNRVSLMLVAGFFALALMTGMSMSELLSHAGAGAVVLLFGFGCFSLGWIGGGDAKLAAATGLWLGFSYLMIYLLYASLLGGALTLLLLEFRVVPLPGLLTGRFWAERLHQKGGDVPYGIALAGSALLVYPDTPWMRVIGF
jgi:prepilin peptidase CpaA